LSKARIVLNDFHPLVAFRTSGRAIVIFRGHGILGTQNCANFFAGVGQQIDILSHAHAPLSAALVCTA
jgi:hypothetical protein